ncbi:MAG: hypothetical protein H0U81_10615 [Pyrinomonadaceae bacterium]|nr:hypothetical protein [Pyrinomonadaceae bacterium]
MDLSIALPAQREHIIRDIVHYTSEILGQLFYPVVLKKIFQLQFVVEALVARPQYLVCLTGFLTQHYGECVWGVLGQMIAALAKGRGFAAISIPTAMTPGDPHLEIMPWYYAPHLL